MYIYKITNKINNKIYIGQTIKSIEKRFRQHISVAKQGRQNRLAKAIRKYGPENFYIEIIDTATTKEELNQKELNWMYYYNSLDPKNGYNETDFPGTGGNTYQFKTETELDEIKEKVRITKIGEKNPHARAVKFLNTKTNEELHFKTIIDAQLHFQENTHRFITTRVTHITRGLYKNEWAIAYEEENYQYEKHVYKTGKPVICTNLKTNKITNCPSIRMAARTLGFQRKHECLTELKQTGKTIIDDFLIEIPN